MLKRNSRSLASNPRSHRKPLPFLSRDRPRSWPNDPGRLLTVRSLDGMERAVGETSRGSVRVFVSFDREHDEELYELLLEQSSTAASGFEVLGSSDRSTDAGLCSGRMCQQIREADQVIVICGEHTGASPSVCAELRIAREEGTPHFLLWGHRESMCTKPIGADAAEGMYSWTPEILQERLAYTRRTNTTAETPHEVSRNG